jgi:signal peptidase
MKENKSQKSQSPLKIISTIISWAIFIILLICIVFLAYYFIATRIYAAKGAGYEPQFSLYTIVSPSMVPNIKVYDVVLDTKVSNPEDIKVNDVITFNSDIPELKGGTITHRVISIKEEDGKYYYQTKGDANILEDSELVEFEDIVGRVAIKIPQLGRIQFFLASKLGWILVVLAPALYIIVKDIFKIMKLIKDPNDPRKRSKFIEFLNKPLLVGKSPKLITFKEDIKSDNTYQISNDNQENNNNYQDNSLQNKPECYTSNESKDDEGPHLSFMDSDEEVDEDDLPSLK